MWQPILGDVNFCPSSVSADPAQLSDQRATAVHELLHALGFTSSSWALFRDDTGQPRTRRDADGK
eukprot:2414192-Prymnesium_polylepis.1